MPISKEQSMDWITVEGESYPSRDDQADQGAVSQTDRMRQTQLESLVSKVVPRSLWTGRCGKPVDR